MAYCLFYIEKLVIEGNSFVSWSQPNIDNKGAVDLAFLGNRKPNQTRSIFSAPKSSAANRATKLIQYIHS